MKKVSLFLIGVLLGLSVIAQPVVDNAIIPVAVNLNSILRLNVTSGGNIEFSVNNIDQYTDGIANSDNYDTKFTVASSVDFDVIMYAEGGFIGTDDGTNAFPVDNVGYIIESTGTAVITGKYQLEGAFDNPSDITPLSTTVTHELISGVDGGSAGNATDNAFTINWELATANLIAANTTGESLLQQSLPADRYSTNVFLVLQPTP
jgi:hypothetical protein